MEWSVQSPIAKDHQPGVSGDWAPAWRGQRNLSTASGKPRAQLASKLCGPPAANRLIQLLRMHKSRAFCASVFPRKQVSDPHQSFLKATASTLHPTTSNPLRVLIIRLPAMPRLHGLLGFLLLALAASAVQAASFEGCIADGAAFWAQDFVVGKGAHVAKIEPWWVRPH